MQPLQIGHTCMLPHLSDPMNLCLRQFDFVAFARHTGLNRRGKKAAEIGDGIVGDGHLAQMIFPNIGLDSAPCEGLARDLNHFAPAVDPRIGDGWNAETYERAGSPEALREFMGEEQTVVAAFGCDEGESLLACRANGAGYWTETSGGTQIR